MRNRTRKNVLKVTNLIIDKGYPKEEAKKIAMRIFDQINKNTPPAEYFINLIIPYNDLMKEYKNCHI